ncbi:MAG: hypothetical protein VCA74_02020 [Deltaproteobacteria bacterium]
MAVAAQATTGRDGLNPHLRSRIDLVTSEARQLLGRAVDGMGLSARAVSRVLNVARTIADLATDESIQASHLGEALQYRPGPLCD